jgi:NADP-dependent 3-hydroxy acid dehydrogenase YdfG
MAPSASLSANEGFLTPEDVASVVVSAALLPPHANRLEQTIIPLQQPRVGRG